MEPVRVLQVLDQISYNSGACAVIMNYYRHMDHRKVQFDFMVHEAPDEELQKKIMENGSKIYQMPSLSMRNMLLYPKALKKFFEEHRDYQVVHGNIPNASAFYLRAARRAGVPVRILHAHSARGADKVWKRIRNYLLSRIGVCHANTYFACSKTAAVYLFGKDISHVHMVKNAIEVETYRFNQEKRAEYREKLHVDDDTLLLGHVGRFSEEKNHLFLLEVLYEVRQRGVDCKLLLVGDGEKRKEIENHARELGVWDAVICTGVVNHVGDYLNAMDVFLLPSLFEGLPVVGIEAQCNGLPCLFSDRITREAGILSNVRYLPIRDATMWAEELGNEKQDRVSDAWKKIVRAGYSIRHEAKKLEEFLKNH